MTVKNKAFWVGICASPIILILIYVLNSGSTEEKHVQVIESTPTATFDFVPTLPQTPVSDKSFTHISQEDNTKKDIQLTQFSGKPTIVHFWATWCGSCVDEMPELDEFSQKYGDDINVVVIASDQTGGQAAKEFYENKNLKGLKLYIDEHGDLIRSFKIQGLPTTIFVSPTSQELGRVVGPIEWSKDSGKVIHSTLKQS